MSSHECPQCSKSFVNQTLLRRHVESACFWPDEERLDSRNSIFASFTESLGSSDQLLRHLQSRSLFTPAAVHVSMTTHADGDGSNGSQLGQINKLKQFSLDENDQNVEAFQCELCPQSYDTKIKLQRHMSYHKNRKVLYCGRCSQYFCTSNSLRRHENIHRRFDARKRSGSENEKNAYACPRCDRRFDCWFMLARHKRNHIDNDKKKDKVHHCSHCSRSFSTSAKLDHHKVTHGEHTAAKKGHTCQFCNKHFVRQSLFYKHLEQVHCHEDLSRIGPVHACSKCSQIFMEAGRLRAHALQIHNESEDSATVLPSSSYGVYTCSQCGKGFKSRASLSLHWNTHTGDRPFQCRAGCNRRFAQNSTRKYHERTHSDATPHICPVCGVAFKHSTMLRLHSRLHTGVRPHKCPSCPKAFPRSSQLTEHLRVHTRECPFVCSTCSRQFRSQSTLLRHEKAVHRQLKPWQCSVCDKTFTQPGNLRVHMRVHTHEKPFVCSYCNLQFSYSASLKSHMRVHEQR